jgi:uncharacterized membrane protein
VEKFAAYADNNGNIISILSPDPGIPMSDYLLYSFTLIGVFVFVTKQRINNQLVPTHLHWLKALLLCIGRFDPVTAFGVINAQHHHIDAQIDRLRLLLILIPVSYL